jgi:S-formylglutathione hydrolase FrmB
MLRTVLRSCLLLAAVALNIGGTDVPHGSVRRDAFWSPTLGVRKRMLVYLPPSYDTSSTASRRYAVAVYLHGRWGDETDWVRLGNLPGTMDSLVATGMSEMIVVMPDGDDGWWTTWASPSDSAACSRAPHRTEPASDFCVPHGRYDDYVAHDVLAYVDSTYRTFARRESRGIGGLSMGGYGAVAIAAKYPDSFAAAVSHGGVLTPGLLTDSSTLEASGEVTWRMARTRTELQRAAGPIEWAVMYPMFGLDSLTWRARDPARLLRQVKRSGKPLPALYADAAIDDERLAQNREFRAAMAASRIPLSYAEWKGKHTWTYWQQHLPDGLRFISDHLVREAIAQKMHP